MRKSWVPEEGDGESACNGWTEACLKHVSRVAGGATEVPLWPERLRRLSRVRGSMLDAGCWMRPAGRGGRLRRHSGGTQWGSYAGGTLGAQRCLSVTVGNERVDE